MGKREQNKADKLRRLTRAARERFARQGYDATSIGQIVRDAGVARGTFYLYFPDRIGVFEALVDRWFQPLLEILDDERRRLSVATSRAESLAIYQDIGARIAGLALSHRNEVLIALQELRTPGEAGDAVRVRERRLADEVVALTELAARRGLIDAPDPWTDARVVLGAIERLFWEVLADEDVEDPLAVAAEVVRFLSRGLGLT